MIILHLKLESDHKKNIELIKCLNIEVGSLEHQDFSKINRSKNIVILNFYSNVSINIVS